MSKRLLTATNTFYLQVFVGCTLVRPSVGNSSATGPRFPRAARGLAMRLQRSQESRPEGRAVLILIAGVICGRSQACHLL